MKGNKRFLTIFVVILICLTLNEISFATKEVNVDKNIYLVILNRYTLQDLKYMPNLNSIINDGSIGLMNTRGLVGYKGVESYLTINSSNKAIADYESAEIYNLDDRYKEMYERRLGPINRESNLANLSLNRIIEKNEDNNYTPFIGALGENLHNKNICTASYGNADTIDYVRRPGSLIPMDSKGLIDYGNVDNILVSDISMPYGFRTNYDKLLEEVINIKNKASLIVIDTGDLDRLFFYSSQMADSVFMEQRQSILSKIDNFIGELKENIDKDNSMLMIISPNSGDERVEDNKLSHLILWGSKINHGILSSPTTKQNGIVTNLDIGPTITEFLGASRINMIGNGINSKKMDNNLEYIINLNDKINVISNSRHTTLLIFAVLASVIIILSGFLLLLKLNIKGTLYELISYLLILIVSVPLVLIISSLFNIDSYFKFISIILILLSLISFVIYKLRSNYKLILILGLIYIILVIDVFTNGYITRYSVLAPDPIIGARYFGIGNELVGVFLGATLIFTGFILDKTNSKLLTTILLVFSVILVGHPKLGANVGGSISLLFAVLYFILELRDGKISLKRIFSLGILVILFVVLMAYIDTNLNSTPTHLGKAFMMFRGNKKSSINIILRKILMNIKLLGSSVWAKVLYIVIFLNIMIINLLNERLNEIYKSEKGMSIGLISVVVGSLIGFLFNDSGVLLSSMAMVFVVITLLFILLNYEKENI